MSQKSRNSGSIDQMRKALADDENLIEEFAEKKKRFCTLIDHLEELDELEDRKAASGEDDENLKKLIAEKKNKTKYLLSLEAADKGIKQDRPKKLKKQDYPKFFEADLKTKNEQRKKDFHAMLRELEEMDCYIDSAFRSSRTNQVFMFIQYEYVVINYDPASPTKDRVVKGPLMICDGFPQLYCTRFQEYGVDAAFRCHGVDEAFLFSSKSCVKINFDPDTQTGDMINRPKDIEEVFPCLATIKFDQKPLDAAFESTVMGEAYLFQGSNYALINYCNGELISTGLITDLFPCLLNTIFAIDIGAAFASHTSNQAYLFKDNSYVLIHFSPGETSDSYIVAGPEEIVPTNWPSLRGIVPFKNKGLDCIGPETWTAVWGGNGWVRAPIDYYEKEAEGVCM